MLTLEQKKEIFDSYGLKETRISNDRFNFEFLEGKQRRKVLARELHQSGNGYVLGVYIPSEIINKNGYRVDSRGWISIKSFTKEELKAVIEESIRSMS